MDFNFISATQSDTFLKIPDSLKPKLDVTRIVRVAVSAENNIDRTANATIIIGADGYIKLRNLNTIYRCTAHITYSL